MKTLFVATLSLCLLSPGFATVGLYGEAHQVLAVNPAGNMVDAHNQTGWQTTPAISWSDQWSTTGYEGASLSASMYYTADYGYLTTGAAAAVASSPGTGAFASSTPYNADYNAAFDDVLTADQDMTLAFDMRINDVSSLHYDVQGQNFTNLTGYLFANGAGGQATYSGSGIYDITGTVNVTAGSQVQIYSWLAMSCMGSANVQAYETADYSLDASAELFVTNLTPGTTYHSQSGHVYQSVPEPSELMFGAVSVLGLIGMGKKRRSGLGRQS